MSGEADNTSPNDSALFLRVKIKMKSEESREEVISALKLFVAYQLKHPIPGTLLYHFSRPDPDNEPLLMQFCELYSSTKVFMEHTDDEEVKKRYTEAFFPKEKNIEISTTYAYGQPTKDPQMKGLLDFVLSADYPESVDGHLLPSNPKDVLGSHSDPALLTAEFTVKASEVGAVTESLKALSASSDGQALMFHIGNVSKTDESSTYQITAIYPSNAQLTAHVQAAKTKLQEVAKLSSSFSCLLFGVSDENKPAIEACGFPVQYRVADAGYELHPLAKTVFSK